MVWNEQLKREIPEGWNVGNILFLACVQGGGTPSTDESSFWNGTIPFYTPKDASDGYIAPVNTVRKISELGIKNSSTQVFDDAVFLTARGTVGKVQMPRTKMAMNQSCYALCPRSTTPIFYLFFVVKSIVEALKVKASGAIFDAIVTRDIQSIELPLPKPFIVQSFARQTESILRRMIEVEKELEGLGKLRDFLLPLLMNGQVQVRPQGELNYDLAVSSMVGGPALSRGGKGAVMGVFGAFFMGCIT